MRAIALVVLLAGLTSKASAGGLLDIGGLAELVAQKAKESKAASLVSLEGKVSGGVYLPIWTYHSPLDGKETDFYEMGIGGDIARKENARPLLTMTANAPALSGRFWSSAWAKTHVRRSVFPPIWFGPQFRIPVPSDKFQWRDWKEYVGAIVSIGFGK